MSNAPLTEHELDVISRFEPSEKVALILEELCSITEKSRTEFFQFAKELAYRNAQESRFSKSGTDASIQRANRIFRRALELVGEKEALMQEHDEFMYFINREKCIVMLATAEIELADEGIYSLTT